MRTTRILLQMGALGVLGSLVSEALQLRQWWMLGKATFVVALILAMFWLDQFGRQGDS